MDKLFSDGLKNFEKAPDPFVWDRIEQELGKKKRKRRIIYYSSIAASLALLFSFGAGYFMSLKKFTGMEVQVAEVTTLDSSTSNEPNIANASKSISQRVLSEQSRSSNEEPAQKTIVTVVPVRISDKAQTTISKDRKWLPSLPDPSEKQELLASVMDWKKEYRQISASDVRNDKESVDAQRIRYNQMLMAQHEKEKKEKRKWSLMGQVSPSASLYSGGNTSQPMDYAAGLSQKREASEEESELWSVGGGMKINIPTGKRLSIQAGIYYSRLGHKTVNGGGAERAYSTNHSGFSDIGVATQNIKTAAGYVRVKAKESLPMDGMMSTIVRDNTSPVAVGSELKQYFETIELPLLMRYNLIDRRVSFHLMGGLSTNFIVGNKVYMNTGNGDEYIGETAEIQRTNFSTNLGFGLEYGLSSRIRLSVEPSLKYYLNSISKNNNFNYRPFSLGVYTGLSFEF